MSMTFLRVTRRFCKFFVMAGLMLLTISFSAGAAVNPANCFDVKYKNPAATDGDYLIEPISGKAFNVYCADMNGTPKEYLSLINTGGNFNFSQITAGGARPGTNVRTYYTKLRIDPITFLVDVDDFTFSTSTGECLDCVSQVLYGMAGDCVKIGSKTGLANVDLTGTPFAVNDIFKAQGWNAAGSVAFNDQVVNLGWEQSVSVVSQVVNLTGGGYCGGVRTGSYPYHYLMQLKWLTD